MSSPIILFPDEIAKLLEKEASLSRIGDSLNPEYQYWLDNCTKEDEMPYFNETLNVYQCYPLLTQGPCEPNEWFVLEESQPNKTVCVEKPCISESISNSQELGDSIINFNYEDGSTTDSVDDEFEDFSFYEVLFNGECKSKNDFTVCPSGQELLTNAFGIGECGCMEGFLPYIEKNESFSCYQEFLQGPCSEGQQYIKPDDDIPDFEPTCVPTDCKKDETKYIGSCVPVPICDNQEDYVLFVDNLTTNTTTTRCEHLHLGQRGDLIGGSKHCRTGYRLDSRGNCKKTIQNGGRRNVRRQTITYGRGRNIRRVCCG